MYCNNCGHEIQDDQQFCTKCGKETVQKETPVCEQCGNPIGNNAKFCNICGTPVKTVAAAKTFCSFCGTQMKDSEQFCPNCGKAASGEKAILDTDAKKASSLKGAGKGNVTSTNIVERLRTPIGIKHAILAGALALLLILIYLPTFQIESVYASWFDTDYSYTTSVANPLFGSTEVAEMLDYADADARAVYNIFSFVICFFDFIFLALAIWVTVKPILCNTLTKHRRFIYQTLIAIFWFFVTTFWWLIFAALGSADYGVNIGLTFSGILVLILCVVIVVLSRIIARDNRVLRERGYADVKTSMEK